MSQQRATHRCDCGRDVLVTATRSPWEFGWACLCKRAGVISHAHASPPPRLDSLDEDTQRWALIEDALHTPDLKSDQARLLAISSVVQSRKPLTAGDVARTEVLAIRHGWTKEKVTR